MSTFWGSVHFAATSKTNPHPKIPSLRFPEFSGEWEEKKLGEVGEIITGNTPPTAQKDFYNGEYLFVSPIDISNSRFIFKTKTTLTEKGFKYGRRIKKGDVMFVSIGSTIGKVAQAGIDCITNQQINTLQSNDENLNDFLYEVLSKNSGRIKLLAGKQAVPILNKSEFSKIKITIPTKPEQEKIASFLSSVDDWVENLEGQKKEWEEYKKGLMQKLFPKKGQTKPDLRFKGFDREWEEKKLGEVCVKKSSNISANSLKDNEGEYKIYGATGILQKVNFYTEDEKYIAIIKDGAGVGRLLLCDEKTSVLGTLDILLPTQDVNLRFLHALLEKVNFTKYIIGSTIPHIYFKDYKKEKKFIPSFTEQEKIASFLTSIDDIISNIEKQIQEAKAWKKGLMQRMFV